MKSIASSGNRSDRPVRSSAGARQRDVGTNTRHQFAGVRRCVSQRYGPAAVLLRLDDGSIQLSFKRFQLEPKIGIGFHRAGHENIEGKLGEPLRNDTARPEY